MRSMRIFLTFFAVVLLAISFEMWDSFSRWESPQLHLREGVEPVVIPQGMGTRQILSALSNKGYLPAPWRIALPYAWYMRDASLKAGEYEIDPYASPKAILEKIARGEVIRHSITFPEGWTSAQMRAALLAEPLLTGGVPASLPEGRFAPDTWEFRRDQSRETLLRTMQQAMDKRLAEAWAQRAPNLPLASPEEALILASIVEKETGLPEERAMVAAVFINRLRMGMRLQTDPTVAYGIAPEGLSRPLTRADLAADTPYNTYLRAGLPPTPICNPSKAALEAALHPAASKALYFVATGKGGHRFADRLADHNANVRAYRAALRSLP